VGDIDWAVELEPGNVSALYTRALVHIDLERFEQALADLDRVFERRPEALDALWARSRALLRLGREDEALAAADEAIETHPASDLALRRRAILLLLMGRVDEALATADRAVKHAPQEAWNYLGRARAILATAAGCRRALADLATARELAPDDLTVATDIAWQHSTMVYRRCPDGHDGGLALDLARLAVEDLPGGDSRQSALGLALYREGRYPEAREAVLRAVELRTPKPEPWELFALAMIEWKLGDRVRPRRYYDAAVARVNETYPRFPEYLMFRQEAARLLGIRP
jgi:tetratricopeptide (TPR) repeat protein